jgi:hypothetical protein
MWLNALNALEALEARRLGGRLFELGAKRRSYPWEKVTVTASPLFPETRPWREFGPSPGPGRGGLVVTKRVQEPASGAGSRAAGDRRDPTSGPLPLPSQQR